MHAFKVAGMMSCCPRLWALHIYICIFTHVCIHSGGDDELLPEALDTFCGYREQIRQAARAKNALGKQCVCI